MKVLFIGGTGTISTSSSTLAVQRGIELWLLNRGKRGIDIPGTKTIKADINNETEARKVLNDMHFDAVVNWIAFTPDQIERDIRLFSGKVNQYIFISSSSVYQKPAAHYIITESTPLVNPYWEYSRNKIACEERLMKEYRENGFPFTTVRPSLTYNDRLIPLVINSWSKSYTVIDRMKKGKKILIPGDGNSLWTITHADDFAKGFLGLLGNRQSIGHAFHITSDEVLTWNQFYEEAARAVGAKAEIVHIPSDTIVKFCPWEQGSLHGDKSVSCVFDNRKIKCFVPDFTATITWAQGIRRTLEWFQADKSRMQIDDDANKLWDRMIAAWEKISA